MSYDKMRTFNKRLLNPITRKIAGAAHSPFALVYHVGWRSGKSYETPIIVEPWHDGFMIALTYGSGVDWYRNVRAAGRCTVGWHGKTYALDQLTVVEMSMALPAFPLFLRSILRLRHTRDFVNMKARQVAP